MSEFIKHDNEKPEFHLVPKEFHDSMRHYETNLHDVLLCLSRITTDSYKQIEYFHSAFIEYMAYQKGISLLEYEWLTAEVMTLGKKKYSEDNWKECRDLKRYINALIRHTRAYLAGEKNDPDSGISHVGHIGCNIAFILWFLDEKNTPTLSKL